ncbi:MAG TPA: dihydrodipicolinate reductase C-terminal domain-containing protein [Planctomycetota bacterium]|jgi:4-hydroxy-tetrahydrodipicolinate reductase|nr:dihydrodipicolinate reductase C-terminal domain-containing protein [Planctomycetota bacterium]
MKIAINGACGRMGQAVAKAAADAGVEVAALIDVVKGPGVVRSLAKKVDALIDFSTPEASLERLAECVKTKTPAIVCTTGFSDAQKAEIAAASKKIPVIYSSNMSVGVNLLFKRVPEIAKTLGESYDIDIIETHHRFKKDAPSGTAKTLAERIESATGRKPNVHAVRSGDVVGEHRIVFGTLGDSIEIIHRASTRDIFAKGSIEAAKWAAKAKPGLYTMLDVIE